MSTEIVKVTSIINSMSDVERAAAAMQKSGFFSDVTDLSKAVVKILAGQEIGIGAFASMVGIHIIKGKPTYGANIIAAKIKASGKYNYIVDEMTEKVCKITFKENGETIGQSVFTIEDAKKAGTQNTDKFPRNMLFARAISNGYRWFCPDVTMVTMYTPEEFGAVVNDEGNIIDAESKPVAESSNGDKLIERMTELLAKAATLGIDTKQYELVDGDLTSEIIKKGKSIAAEIKTKEGK